MQIVAADDFVAAVRAARGEPPASYGEIMKVNLGAPRPAEDKVVEWELGRNQCG
jgi:hypothetical protein